MKMYELMISLKQSGNRKKTRVVVQADNQITAKQLVNAQYAGSDTRIVSGPKEIKQPKK
jgi:hypothetical protein